MSALPYLTITSMLTAGVWISVSQLLELRARENAVDIIRRGTPTTGRSVVGAATTVFMIGGTTSAAQEARSGPSAELL